MTQRTFEIPAHLWAALEQMSAEMAVPTPMLVNQALFSWARMNGYVVPSSLEGAAPSPAIVQVKPHESLPTPAPAPAPKQKPAPAPEPEPDTRKAAIVEEPAGWTVRAAGNIDTFDSTAPSMPALKRVVMVLPDREVVIDAKRFVVGRDPSCNLTIESGRISRQHAAIHVDGDKVEIEDLKSSNGTWFKGERITRRVVQPGDEFYIGDALVHFEVR